MGFPSELEYCSQDLKARMGGATMYGVSYQTFGFFNASFILTLFLKILKLGIFYVIVNNKKQTKKILANGKNMIWFSETPIATTVPGTEGK